MMSTSIPELPDSYWTMDIEPQRSLLDLRLGELWRYRDLVTLIVHRNFEAVYQKAN